MTTVSGWRPLFVPCHHSLTPEGTRLVLPWPKQKPGDAEGWTVTPQRREHPSRPRARTVHKPVGQIMLQISAFPGMEVRPVPVQGEAAPMGAGVRDAGHPREKIGQVRPEGGNGGLLQRGRFLVLGPPAQVTM